MSRLVAVLTKNDPAKSDPGSPNFERSPPSSPYGFSGFYHRTDSPAADYWNALQYSHTAERLEIKQPRCFRFRKALQALVIHPDSQFARSWYIVTGLLLAYVATIFPYRLCFIELRAGIQDDYKSPTGWKVFETIVDVFFWMDLIINFFLAVRDECGNIITDQCIITRRYLLGWFWIDLLACLDPQVVMYMLGGSGSTRTNKAIRFLRMYRLGRLSRLFKLMRLWRLLRLFRIVRAALKFPVIQALEKALSYSHTIAMIKLVIGILWLAHILGCGAYVVVAHGVDSETDTWLHRRGIYHATPFHQWVASCYFVLTTLLTVGFGDMYPLHVAEMMYHIVLQLIGTVLQCVVLSEISKALSGWREQKLAREAIQSNVNRYIAQTRIGPDEASALTQALEGQHREIEMEKGAGYDRSKVLQIIKGTFPHSLQRSVARRVFDGVCERNALFWHVPSVVDSNVSLAVAVFLTLHVVRTSDYLYHVGDRATNIFLVLKGIAAHVARPSPLGGHLDTADMDLWGMSFLHLAYSPFWLLPYDTYFGDLELVLSHGGRVSSVRAETDMELLSLPKAVLVLLSKDFPSFVSNLRYAAIERRRRFDGLLKRHVARREFQHFAASRIQEVFRLRRGRLKMLSEERARENISARAALLPAPKPKRRSKQPSQRGGSRQRRQIQASKIRQCSNSLSPSRASKVRTVANVDEIPMVSMTDEEAAAFLPELREMRRNHELLEKKRVEILQNQKTMLNVLSQLHIRLVHEQ